MVIGIIMATGRILVRIRTMFPLSIRFLDEDYRDDEAQHLSVGLLFYGVVFALVVTLFLVR